MYTLKDFGAERYEAKLNNGIRVILFYRSKAPISAQAFLRSGSSFDAVGKEGMAHLIEHMIMNGSARFPSKSELIEHIEAVGGVAAAGTSPEYLSVNAEVPDKEDFGRTVDVFNGVLCNPLMDKTVFENEKHIVTKEIASSQAMPNKLLYRAMAKIMFGDTRYEYRAFGTVESVESITYEEMLLAHKVLFDASRVTFVVSGDISIEEVVEHLNRLEFFSENPYVADDTTVEIKPTNRIGCLPMDTKQTSIFIGFYSAPIFSREALCMEIVGKILAWERTGRLVQILRYEKGLAYSTFFSGYSFLPFSVKGIFTGTTEDKVQEVITETLKEIDHVNDQGITQKELEQAKNKLVKSLKRSMQTSYSWVGFHALGEALSPSKYHPIDEYANEISSITVAEVNSVIKKYLSSTKAYVATVGRTKVEDITI